MKIIEAMKQRRSVRTFDGSAITTAQHAILERAIAGATSPFGGNGTICLKQFDRKAGWKYLTIYTRK